MFANFNKSACVGASELGMPDTQLKSEEAPRGTLVERVCSFLERYPLSHAMADCVAPSISTVAVVAARTGQKQGQRCV